MSCSVGWESKQFFFVSRMLEIEISSYLLRLYFHGIDIPIGNLYPAVKYPVSAGTPMISPLIRWDHTEDWFLAKFDSQRDGNSAERICKISFTDHDFGYVSGHVIDGEFLLKFSFGNR